MKIGVVSDTHSRPIPKQLMDDFKDVDLIIHGGDFCSIADYNKFADLKPVKAVFGNMDDPTVRKKLPEKIIFKAGECSIGIFHGEGPAQKILDPVKNKFKGDKVHVIVFGHSHQALNESINGTLFFNPGSPNDTVCAAYCSYGFLEIDGAKVKGRIVKIKG